MARVLLCGLAQQGTCSHALVQVLQFRLIHVQCLRCSGAVQEAVRGEFPEIVQLLLQNGARVCENHKLVGLQVRPQPRYPPPCL